MMIGGFDEFQKAGKDNMDTVVKSAGAWTKGFQALATEAADYSRSSFEKSAKAVREAGCGAEPRQGGRGPERLRPRGL